ncbi:glycosyltransferase family 4 protein [Sphingomonas asaccharolytica]|uniref:glycosyltransferase family 4 protein n=1 Tax=Sphingomonas asaccharolytica TaxID=40681 RepID=UPI000837892D|nr:glycosyltransferase family 4 protein [Sphingomonas asaccharolytica]
MVKILALLTDCFGGKGGIAAYNRALLTALVEDPCVSSVVAVPRQGGDFTESLPPQLYLDRSGYGGRTAYLRTALCRAARDGPDLIFCGHVNLTPIAWLAAKLSGAPWILQIHGIDAWQPSRRAMARSATQRADHVMSVSQLTLDRFLSFSPRLAAHATQIPLPLDLSAFGDGPKDTKLLARYGLQGRKVVMTFGRLSALEQYKGFDEIIDLMPELIRVRPDIAYLVAGDGDDRARLEAKAAKLGVSDRIAFTGFVPEAEKVATYRLADAYVMPSTGEGFGFVLLEAMACGIPAVASTLDGGREAVRDGLLGRLVDPRDRTALMDAILAALDQPRGVPPGLDYFAVEKFTERVRAVAKSVVGR